LLDPENIKNCFVKSGVLITKLKDDKLNNYVEDLDKILIENGFEGNVEYVIRMEDEIDIEKLLSDEKIIMAVQKIRM